MIDDDDAHWLKCVPPVNDGRRKCPLDREHQQLIEFNRSRIGIHCQFACTVDESFLYRKLSHDLHLKKRPELCRPSFRDMNVVPMRVEKKVADIFPGAFASGPGPKELNWITNGLRPVTTSLYGFVKPPSQIPALFSI